MFVLLFYVKLEQDLTNFDEVELCKSLIYIYIIFIIVVVVVDCSNVLCFFEDICSLQKKSVSSAELHLCSLFFSKFFLAACPI